MIRAADIVDVVRRVTKEWSKQRKAEERGRSRNRRGDVYSGHVCFTDVADSILPGAYHHASGGGMYSVGQRQLYYAGREHFRKQTGRSIDYDYFTSSLLRQYLNRHPDETASWRITADPRGSLILPNAGYEVRIPCGTLDIDNHLARTNKKIDPLKVEVSLRTEWPSLAEGQRYQGVLYIEKEGFGPILREARIAERFDLAVLSCKGQSVVAARKFVDSVCEFMDGVPLFVVHDFDKSGFEISQRLTQVSESARESDRVCYEFKNDIDVTDFGLRLSDVEAYGLLHEKCKFGGKFASDSICTEAEKEYLRSGRRVELNAFTSPQLIEWLEAKLREHGLGSRLIPSGKVLEAAYRRAVLVARFNEAIEAIKPEAAEEAERATIPETLEEDLRDAMLDHDRPWDRELYDLVSEKVKNGSIA